MRLVVGACSSLGCCGFRPRMWGAVVQLLPKRKHFGSWGRCRSVSPVSFCFTKGKWLRPAPPGGRDSGERPGLGAAVCPLALAVAAAAQPSLCVWDATDLRWRQLERDDPGKLPARGSFLHPATWQVGRPRFLQGPFASGGGVGARRAGRPIVLTAPALVTLEGLGRPPRPRNTSGRSLDAWGLALHRSRGSGTHPARTASSWP